MITFLARTVQYFVGIVYKLLNPVRQLSGPLRLETTIDKLSHELDPAFIPSILCQIRTKIYLRTLVDCQVLRNLLGRIATLGNRPL